MNTPKGRDFTIDAGRIPREVQQTPFRVIEHTPYFKRVYEELPLIWSGGTMRDL